MSGQHHRASAAPEPSFPPASNNHHVSSDKLSESLNSLSLSNSLPTSPAALSPRGHTPSPLPRRTSTDHRSSASPSPVPGSPARFLSRGPSTPTIKKRSSMVSLNGSSGASNTPQRKSSILSIRSSPTESPREPPPQDFSAATTVVLHDTSYKHRYSRPKTSLADLQTIVERPERIPAAVLGVASAQVRTGRERLSIRKSTREGRLSDPEVMLVHSHTGGQKGKAVWPEELYGMCAGASDKLKRGEVEVPKGFHQGDLYLCGESLEDLQGCIGAVYDGVDLVFGPGDVKRSFVCIRPPGHHCAETQPSGFCWLNNVHIAIAHAAREHGLTHAVILDFDLHHGDGSQAIAWSLNELASNSSASSLKKTGGIHVPSIGYFSLHDINSYPCEYGDVEKIRNASVNLEAHGQFIYNVHLKPYASEHEFWQLYNKLYSNIFAKARGFLASGAAGKQKKNRDFKAGVFLSAGFDASEHESPGMQRHQVNVPTDFFAKFTADAAALADELCDGRVLSVLEGGYSDRALTSGVLAHMAGLTCTPPEKAIFVPPTISVAPELRPKSVSFIWDSDWWSLDSITELERYDRKMTNKPEKAEKRGSSYMSATAASIARTESPHRRIASSTTFGPPPPPPPMPWEQRAWELSRLFIPEYQESVAIPALPKKEKEKKLRHSTGSTAEPASSSRVLRERKAKPVDEPLDDPRRRRTTAGPLLSTVSDAGSRPASRVSSRASTPALPPSRGVTPVPTAGGRTVAPPRAASAAAVRRPAAPQRKASTVGTEKKENIKPTERRSSSMQPPPRPLPQQASRSNGHDDVSAGLEEVTNGMQRVRITYKDRELQRMEREKEELERKLAKEKERRAKLAKEKEEQERRKGPTNGHASPATNEAALENHDIPPTIPQDMPEAADMATEVEKERQSVTPDHEMAETIAVAPVMPPYVQLEMLAPEESIGPSPQMAHDPAQHIPSPPPQNHVVEQQPQKTDHTFQGGEIRFANPFAAATGVPPPVPTTGEDTNGHS